MSRDKDRDDFYLMTGGTELQSAEDIQAYQANIASKIAKLKLQQNAALAEYEARKEEQNSRGIIKNFIGIFTGINNQIKEEIKNSFQRAQSLGREIERLKEESARLQAIEHRIVHADMNSKMKSIGRQTSDIAKVGEKISESVVKLDQRISAAEAIISENNRQINERIVHLESQLMNLLSLSNNIASSNQQNFQYIKTHGQNLEMLINALGKKEEIDEQQSTQIWNMQKVLQELMEAFEQECKLDEKQNEDISKIEVAVTNEVEHGRTVDSRLSSLDISLDQEIEHGRKLARGVDSLEVSLNQTIEHNQKIDEKLVLLDQEDARHIEMIHKLQRMTIINAIIASLALILGIILSVFKL